MHSDLNKLKNLIKERVGEDLNDNLLPTIFDIIDQLRTRITRLNDNLEQAADPDEEILFSDEIEKAEYLIKRINEDIKIYDSKGDLVAVHLHASLESEALSLKNKLEQKMNNLQLITDKEVKDYNNIIHKYNLFCNVVESLY